MLAQAVVHDADPVGMCFLGDSKGHSLSAFMSDVIEAGPIQPGAIKDSMLLTTLLSLQGINECYGARSAGNLRDFLRRGGDNWLSWPPLPSGENAVLHEYGMSTC